MTNDVEREEACKHLARARLTRWGYDKSLSPDEFEKLVARDTGDTNVQGDVDAMLAFMRERSAEVAVLERTFKAVDEFVWTLRDKTATGVYDGAMRVRYKVLQLLQRAKGMPDE